MEPTQQTGPSIVGDPTRRALLVGIDFYESATSDPNAKSRNLNGCVNDILAVEKFLRDIKIPEENITKLISPHTNGIPLQVASSSLPTHHNIICELEKIRDSDDTFQVDLLYIHYSSHGIRLQSSDFNIPGREEQLWMALATNDTFTTGKYLSGRRLGFLIKQIIEKKGTKVCLVLDSCYSGGGFRDDSVAENDPAITDRFILESDCGVKLQSDTDEIEEIFATPGPISRDVKDVSNFMAKPVGCTVLAACGTNRTAGEAVLDGKIHGFLTYWMLDVLRQRAIRNASVVSSLMPSYARLRHEVDHKIRGMKFRRGQTPIVRGDENVQFFGNSVVIEKPFCEVLEWEPEDGKLCIDVGSCQGVAAGAIYNIYSKDLVTLPLQLLVEDVYDFHSIGELIDNKALNATTARPKPGDFGILKAWALPKKVLVSLEIEDVNIRDQMVLEIEKTPNLICNATNEKTATGLRVSINAREEFEIGNDNTSRFQRLPPVPTTDPDAVQKVGYMVRHVARYMSVDHILQRARRVSRLKQENFDSQCCVRGSKASLDWNAENGYYSVTEGTPFDYKLTYFSPSHDSVWVAVFEVNSSWGIRKIHPGYGQNADDIRGARDVEHNGVDTREISLKLRITTHIPKGGDEDRSDALDQFLVFVCGVDDRGPPSWDEISLPSLPHNNELLNLEEMAVYIDSLETGRLADVQKVAGPPAVRDWNVLGFRVHTVPAVASLG